MLAFSALGAHYPASPTAPPRSFGTGSPIVAFLWEGSRVQEGPFQEHQLVIEHPYLQGAGGGRTCWSLWSQQPSCQPASCPGCHPPRHLLAALAHSKVPFCSADMRWPKATAAPSNFSTAVTRGPVGTASISARGVQAALCLGSGGLRTQADAVPLQQGPQVQLGSLQEASEGLTVVTDVERQEKAVTEPKKHIPRRPGHGLVAAEACREGDKARAPSSAHPPPASGCS